MRTCNTKKTDTSLKSNIEIHEKLLNKFVEYVNDQWDMNYTTEDIVGVDWETTFLFVHFKQRGHAYPIKHTLSFIPEIKN